MAFNAVVNMVSGTTGTTTSASGSTGYVVSGYTDTGSPILTQTNLSSAVSGASSAYSAFGGTGSTNSISSFMNTTAFSYGGDPVGSVAGVGDVSGPTMGTSISYGNIAGGLMSAYNAFNAFDSGQYISGVANSISAVMSVTPLAWAAPLVSLAGTVLESLFGDMLYGDEDHPYGGVSLTASESGLAQAAGSWALDFEDQAASEQDFADASAAMADTLSTLTAAAGGFLDLTAYSGSVMVGYDSGWDGGSEDAPWYWSTDYQGSDNTGATEYSASSDEALIGLTKRLIEDGALGDVADEVLTVAQNSITTSLEDFGNQLSLAANWDNLLTILSTGTIDWADSVEQQAADTVAAYLDEMRTYQDTAAAGGLDVDAFNDAYETAILRFIGLEDDLVAAMSDREAAFRLQVEEIENSADLLQQVGYNVADTIKTIGDALSVALTDAREEFYAGIDYTYNSIKDKEYLNEFDDYYYAYKEDIAYAELLRADTAPVDALWAALVESILAGADGAGTAATELAAAFPDLADSIWLAYDAVRDTTTLWSEAFSALGDPLTADLISYDAERSAGRGAYAGSDLEVYDATTEVGRAQLIYDAYVAMAEDQIGSIEDSISALDDFRSALLDLADVAADLRVSDLSSGSLADRLAEAQSQYYAAVARVDDTSLSSADRAAAADDLADLAQTRLELEREYYASSEAYDRAFQEVQDDLLRLSGTTYAEIDSQTSLLQAQLDALGVANDNLSSVNLSVEELQVALTTSFANLQTALTSLGSMTGGVATAGAATAGSAINWDAYLAANDDVAAAVAAGQTTAYDHYNTWGKEEGRTAYTYSNEAITGSFDAVAYLAANDDVAAAVASGQISAYDHYVRYGAAEGRTAYDTTGHAYASGTLSAAAGWALVGEEGPELVQMRGGERVYDAGETGRMFSARSFEFVDGASQGHGGGQNYAEMVAELRQANARLAAMEAQLERQTRTTAAGAVETVKTLREGNATSARAASASERRAAAPRNTKSKAA